MTRGEAVTMIEDRLGKRTGLSMTIISELRLAQGRLERARTLPWFLLKKSTGLATVATVQLVAAPTDFLREHNEGRLRIVMADGARFPLDKDDYHFLTDDSDLDSSGRPTHYALVGSTLYLFPTADDAYPLELVYYGADAPLTSDIENLWLQRSPDLVIAEAGLMLARIFRDEAAIAFFKEEKQIRQTELVVENIAREQAAMSSLMGG